MCALISLLQQNNDCGGCWPDTWAPPLHQLLSGGEMEKSFFNMEMCPILSNIIVKKWSFYRPLGFLTQLIKWNNPNPSLSQFTAPCMLNHIRWSQGERNSYLGVESPNDVEAGCDLSFFLPLFPTLLSLSATILCLLQTHIHLNTTIMF